MYENGARRGDDWPPAPDAAAWAAQAEVPLPELDEDWRSEDVPEAVWLVGLPPEVREDYLAGPYTGDGEAIPVGFTHHDSGGRTGLGFAAGGACDSAAPGPGLYSALCTITAGGYDGLGESELIGVMNGWRRAESQAAARTAMTVAALARRRLAQSQDPGRGHVREHVADEVAAALSLTIRSANRLLEVSLAIVTRLPGIVEALDAGLIDWPKAVVLAEELAELSDELARQVVARVLAELGRATTAQLRRRLRQEVLNADPDAAELRKQQARKQARVELWSESSGNSALAGREMRAADAIAVDKQLTSCAEWLQSMGAPGTISELRLLAFTALLTGTELSSLLPSDAGTRREPTAADAEATGVSARGTRSRLPLTGRVNLTIPLATFAGMAERCGEVAGYGPLNAADCRGLVSLMAPAARCCLTVTDQAGRAVGHACARLGDNPQSGREAIRWAAGLKSKLQMFETSPCHHARESAGYHPAPSLRHLVQIRQPTCSAPGCRRSAERCDLEHAIPYDHGGRSCECNLHPCCRRHHRCKQAPGWHLTQDRPGYLTWQTPSGRTYRTEPQPYPV